MTTSRPSRLLVATRAYAVLVSVLVPVTFLSAPADRADPADSTLVALAVALVIFLPMLAPFILLPIASANHVEIEAGIIRARTVLANRSTPLDGLRSVRIIVVDPGWGSAIWVLRSGPLGWLLLYDEFTTSAAGRAAVASVVARDPSAVSRRARAAAAFDDIGGSGFLVYTYVLYTLAGGGGALLAYLLLLDMRWST